MIDNNNPSLLTINKIIYLSSSFQDIEPPEVVFCFQVTHKRPCVWHLVCLLNNTVHILCTKKCPFLLFFHLKKQTDSGKCKNVVHKYIKCINVLRSYIFLNWFVLRDEGRGTDRWVFPSTRMYEQKLVSFNGRTKCHIGTLVRHLETEHLQGERAIPENTRVDQALSETFVATQPHRF